MTTIDPTRIELSTDPATRRMSGVAFHGNTPFDVPFISEIADNLWQGGCETGLILPRFIKHVVSLYPWERYRIDHAVDSELYLLMHDSEDQAVDQVHRIAEWVNRCRETGPVLVHCQAGLNRSSLIVARALWLAAFDDETLETVGDVIIQHLRDKRSPACLCNKAFEDEVRSWR